MLIHNKDDIEFVTEFPCFWDTLFFNFWIKNLKTDREIICFQNENMDIFFILDQANFLGTIENWTCQSKNGGSLRITIHSQEEWTREKKTRVSVYRALTCSFCEAVSLEWDYYHWSRINVQQREMEEKFLEILTSCKLVF